MKALPPPELQRVQLGFVPLLDCALLVIAREQGFFAEQGLDVVLCRQNAWSTLRDKVAAGLLDGGQMLAPLPLAMTLGLGSEPCKTLAALNLSRNGNAIVLSQALAERANAGYSDEPAASARALGGYLLRGTPERPPRLAMVHPHSCQHYQLRQWLDLGEIDPQRDVELAVMPPPRMVEAMQRGEIDGFCVGEPWGTLAEARHTGRIVATGAQLWPDHPEKVLGVTRRWAERYPATLCHLIRALHYASQWLALDPSHLRQARDWLALPPYLDRSVEHLDHLPLGEAPLLQRMCGTDMLRPEASAMQRFATQMLSAASPTLAEHDTLETCYSPVHYDTATHH
ncbi:MULTISPECIES: CmpA/NrtA family ABC transporter substrate-binding protein [Halomonadaceae]|uniref:CmpA/NrtA family ABC transporter substrate-binding protein n=1 Tax=Halomonadaceae TaxID=28256 RepID=UPI00159B36C9|nr:MULTISPECIES: CmpA/NrtA family ABC transporter substrate-binding protein [Halomonas]QJQ96171.1 ABC transporter substrate-binding protein [Halomonas sp. PA5]